MTLEEAENVFDVCKHWFYPIHSLLFSIFMSNIPISFLPYSKNIIDESLKIMCDLYEKDGNKEASDTIKTLIGMMCFYVDDAEAFNKLKIKLEMNGLPEALITRIFKFKKDWVEWQTNKI